MSKIDTISLEEFDDKWDKFRTCNVEFPETYGNCNGDGCPVNFGNEMTEYSQNMGCLPTPYDIAKMRAVEGKTWSCHADISKPCIGGIYLCKSLGLPTKVIELENWESP